MLSKDGGQTWQKPDGTKLTTPVIADETGPTDRITLDDEFNVHTWLETFLVKNGKVHFVYQAQTTPLREHYVRYDLATAKIDKNIYPDWGGETIKNNYLDGFCASRQDITEIYCVSRGNSDERIGVVYSSDNGETWHDYAKDNLNYAGYRGVYSIGGARSITSDGYLIGAYTESALNPPVVKFFKVKVKTTSVNPVCGNGNLDSGEECDDGNNQNGDGCSSDCKNSGDISALNDFWQGKASWKFVKSLTLENTGWPYGFGAGTHVEVVGDTWYLFSRKVNWGDKPAYCPFLAETLGTEVRKSKDNGATWSAPVDIITPRSGNPWECAATDGDAYFNAAENKWNYLFQCLARDGAWNGCHLEKSGSDPMGMFEQKHPNPIIPAKSLWAKICDRPSDDCVSIPLAKAINSPDKKVVDEGTYDIFRHDGQYYYVSFHGFSNPLGFRGIAKTSDFVTWIAGDSSQGVPDDAVLDANDAMQWRETWQSPGPIGLGAGRIFYHDGYYYMIAEASDLNLGCTAGQNWDFGLFRSTSLTNTAWEQYPLGNPIVYSSKNPDRNNLPYPCNPAYPGIFRDSKTQKTYLHFTRESTNPKYSGIYFYELVPNTNLLKNGDLWTSVAEPWNKFADAGLAVYRYPDKSTDGNNYMALNCGSDNLCDKGDSVYQDVNVNSIPTGQILSYGGKFALDAGSGSLNLVVFELDSAGKIIAKHEKIITLNPEYQSVSATFTSNPGTRMLRYQIYPNTPQTIRADEMFIEPSAGTPKNIVVKSKGDIFDGGPHFNLIVNGNKIGENTASADWQEFSFSFSGTVNTLEIEFDNDKSEGQGKDRNLYVDYVILDGNRHEAETDFTVPATELILDTFAFMVHNSKISLKKDNLGGLGQQCRNGNCEGRLACETNVCRIPGQSGNKLFAQYHLLYTTTDRLPSSNEQWSGWSQLLANNPVTNGQSPDNFISPWKRATMSRLGLPLTGPYSSTVDKEAIKYQFGLAKKAGIDGMFASVYDGNWRPIFKNHLDIAQTAGLNLGLEIYYGVGPDRAVFDSINPDFNHVPMQSTQCTISRNFQIANLVGLVNEFKSHVAYLKINNRPVVWIANYPYAAGKWDGAWPTSDCTPREYYSWGDAKELAVLLNEVEKQTGSFSVVMTGPTADNTGAKFSDIPQILKITTIENIALLWDIMGVNQQITPALSQNDKTNYETQYQSRIDSAKAPAGDKLSLHVYPSFDERGAYPTNANRDSGQNVPRTVITRDGNGMYEKNDGYLKASLDKAKQNNLWVFLESWNDWVEQHQVEPGFSFDNFAEHQDYFSALHRIAGFKGITNPQFTFPPKEIMDAPLVKYCRDKQLTGARVKLKGKLAFKQGAQQSDGINLIISYIDDDKSYASPSYTPSAKWNTFAAIEKKYDGTIKPFEIDITPILDKPKIGIRIDANQNPNYDWIHLTELKLDWYGTEINLADEAVLSSFIWYNDNGVFPWGQAAQSGTAQLANSVVMEDGNAYSNAIYLHPEWITGITNHYVQTELDFMKLKNKLESCSLGFPPSSPPQSFQCQPNDPPVKFLEQKLPPGQMALGQTADVSITVANCGSSVWSKGSGSKGFKLGSRLPADNNVWGLNRIDLPADVSPNQKITVPFRITAPNSEATYSYQWGLINEETKQWQQPFSPPYIVGVGTVVSCPEAEAVKNKGTDSSESLQKCVDRTPERKTLEIPAGVYTLSNQVKIKRSITLRTAGTAGNTATCLMPGAPECAVFKAAPNFPVSRNMWVDSFGLLRIAGEAGATVDHLNNVALDHIVFDGNRQTRLNFGTKCDGNEGHFCANIAVFAHDSSIFYSASINALVGSAFGFDGDRNTFAYNFIANNGNHNVDAQNPHTWADGLTATNANQATIMYNTFKDNSDIDLIIATGKNANVQFNTITHEDSSTWAWGAFMLNAFGSNDLTDFRGGDFSYNNIDCNYRCGFGIMLGGHSWSSKEPNLKGGYVHHNTITRVRQGINIEGAGTPESPLRYEKNTVTNSGNFEVGCGWNSGIFNLAPDSFVTITDTSVPDSRRTWHDCTFDMGLGYSKTAKPLLPALPKSTCNSAGNQVTVSWDEGPGAAVYALRIDDTTVNAPSHWYSEGSTDLITDIKEKSFTHTIIPNRLYNWWVHSGNNAGLGLSDAVGGNFKCQSSGTVQTEYFVSPSGSDSSSGTLEQPFKTLEKARDAVRVIAPSMAKDITIFLRGGTYTLDKTLTFDQRDSGKNGFNIIYKNYQNEKPLISGGRKITGWVQEGDKWKANIGSIQTNAQPRQLYVNGQRATRARSATTPALPVQFKTATGYTSYDWNMQNWRNVQDIELVGNKGWKQYRCGVQSITPEYAQQLDESSGEYVNTLSSLSVAVKQPCWDNAQSHTGETMDEVSWIENAYELLDSPGEWYLNKPTGWIYYKPKAGENMNTADAVVPVVETLIRGSGTLGNKLQNIQFRGITFSYAGWTRPNDNNGFADVQANFHLVGPGGIFNIPSTKIAANIDFKNSKSIKFERNVFTHLGAGGLNFGEGSQDNIISGNNFYDISGNGIMVGETSNAKTTDQRIITKNNQVTNNYIHNVAAEFKGGVGIWLGYTQNSLVAHNELHDLPYTAISIGWGWGGEDPTIAKDNKVQNNLIYDHVKYLFDGGGIYSLSAQPGNVYSGNVIKDQKNEFGALYLDNGARYITVYDNVIFNNKRTAIYKGGDHYFHDNWWQVRGPNDIWHFDDAAACIPIPCGTNRIENNHEINSLSEAPQSIINNAGLEEAYKNIK